MHDINKLHREADRVRAEWLRKHHEELQKKEKKKREYERRISECLGYTSMFARVSFLGIKQPHVVVEVTTRLTDCKPAVGLGVARCWESKDKWNEKKGIEIATKKAVGDAARKIAWLDGWL